MTKQIKMISSFNCAHSTLTQGVVGLKCLSIKPSKKLSRREARNTGNWITFYFVTIPSSAKKYLKFLNSFASRPFLSKTFICLLKKRLRWLLVRLTRSKNLPAWGEVLMSDISLALENFRTSLPGVPIKTYLISPVNYRTMLLVFADRMIKWI